MTRRTVWTLEILLAVVVNSSELSSSKGNNEGINVVVSGASVVVWDA